MAMPLLPAQSITVDELADRLVDGTAPFLVDVRRAHEYAESHIPNAVNIPLAILDSRRLPPLGEVIVYGDGMGRIEMSVALEKLSAKPGIEPVMLEGGYAAWNTRSGVNTGAPGLSDRAPAHTTYEELAARGGEGVVLYDLRKGQGRAKDTDAIQLQDHFPKARLQTGSPYALLKSEDKPEASGATLAGRPESPPGNPLLRKNPVDSSDLIVLIDDDHDSASKMAHRLRAGGFQRVAVLAGGEMIMEFKGRPGLERRGRGSINVTAEEAVEITKSSGEENP